MLLGTSPRLLEGGDRRPLLGDDSKKDAKYYKQCLRLLSPRVRNANAGATAAKM